LHRVGGDFLLDDDSFVELDAPARHRGSNFGLADNRPLGDGVVTGYGIIDRQHAVSMPRRERKRTLNA
jgi:acetyl-CoA carboxylase carboxyltransferase component